MAQLRVIKGGGATSLAPGCTVTLDDTVDKFTDFVTVGWDNTKDNPIILHNADAITLGYACLMIAQAYTSMYEGLSVEDKAIVDSSMPY